MTQHSLNRDVIKALEVLQQVIDPELNINVVDLGLIYGLDFGKEKKLIVTMTLSTPYCPMGDSIIRGVENALCDAFPDRDAEVDLVWEPEWTTDNISEEGKRQLNIK